MENLVGSLDCVFNERRWNSVGKKMRFLKSRLRHFTLIVGVWFRGFLIGPYLSKVLKQCLTSGFFLFRIWSESVNKWLWKIMKFIWQTSSQTRRLFVQVVINFIGSASFRNDRFFAEGVNSISFNEFVCAIMSCYWSLSMVDGFSGTRKTTKGSPKQI